MSAPTEYQLEMLNAGIMPFGKHKRVPFELVPVDYLKWFVNSGTFESEFTDPIKKWAEEAKVSLEKVVDEDAELSQWVSVVGKRIKVFLKVTYVSAWKAGSFGQYRVIKFVDRSKNRFVTFSGKDWVEGYYYQMNITIKEHKEFKGVKETMFNRPHVIKVLDKEGKEV